MKLRLAVALGLLAMIAAPIAWSSPPVSWNDLQTEISSNLKEDKPFPVTSEDLKKCPAFTALTARPDNSVLFEMADQGDCPLVQLAAYMVAAKQSPSLGLEIGVRSIIRGDVGQTLAGYCYTQIITSINDTKLPRADFIAAFSKAMKVPCGHRVNLAFVAAGMDVNLLDAWFHDRTDHDCPATNEAIIFDVIWSNRLNTHQLPSDLMKSTLARYAGISGEPASTYAYYADSLSPDFKAVFTAVLRDSTIDDGSVVFLATRRAQWFCANFDPVAIRGLKLNARREAQLIKVYEKRQSAASQPSPATQATEGAAQPASPKEGAGHGQEIAPKL